MSAEEEEAAEGALQRPRPIVLRPLSPPPAARWLAEPSTLRGPSLPPCAQSLDTHRHFLGERKGVRPADA